ncbi:hypothetical protein DL1_12010 [Thioclava dalianensis]|uniref:Uncharacterized protein n=1 Tax=Thioclava dalianensis TaxID=1185766 RepID=A0A074U180_9RHOB|nr:hypothetical protein [Thioclava dalianensis]KEP68422.1 hypothetical protein DL1_12010 [Thioclava dalianensis]SFN63016.1 hypothetical protein SAMN05216224_10864 [Thioclava dalianensis]
MTIAIDMSQLVTAEARASAALADAKSVAKQAIAAQMTAAREAFVTVLPGQDMVYLAKEAEATAYLADADPDIAHYPLLSAEVGVTAPSAYELAQIWVNMSSIWRGAAASLEKIRLMAVDAIEVATSVDEVSAAMADFNAALSNGGDNAA